MIKYKIVQIKQMENIQKDLIPSIALNLDIKTIYSLCQTSKKFNRLICESGIFWKKKIVKDFPGIDFTDVNIGNTKHLYKYLTNEPTYFYLEVNEVKEFENLDWLNKKFPDAKKGDMVVIEYNEDTFAYSFMWTGNKFYLEDRTVLQVPEEFSFFDFPPYYWSPIYYEDYRVVSDSIIEEAIRNISNGKTYVTGKFGEKYPLIFQKDIDLSYYVTYKDDESLKKYLTKKLGDLNWGSFGEFASSNKFKDYPHHIQLF